MQEIERIKRYIANTKLSYDPRWDLKSCEYMALYDLNDIFRALGLAYNLGMAREHRRLKNAKKC